MSGSEQLRAATPADAAALAQLHAACFAKGWPAVDFAAFAGDPLSLCLVAEAGGQLLGFILCRKAGPEAEILTIAVHPSARRQGIARRLCRAAAALLRGAGGEELHLEVEAENEAALALYRALGFERTGIRKGYYRSSGAAPRDAITMRLALV